MLKTGRRAIFTRDVNFWIKDSNIFPPFWGLSASVLEELKADPRPFMVILRHLEGEIALTSEQVNKLVRGRKISKDGAYKFVLADVEKLKVF